MTTLLINREDENKEGKRKRNYIEREQERNIVKVKKPRHCESNIQDQDQDDVVISYSYNEMMECLSLILLIDGLRIIIGSYVMQRKQLSLILYRNDDTLVYTAPLSLTRHHNIGCDCERHHNIGCDCDCGVDVSEVNAKRCRDKCDNHDIYHQTAREVQEDQWTLIAKYGDECFQGVYIRAEHSQGSFWFSILNWGHLARGDNDGRTITSIEPPNDDPEFELIQSINFQKYKLQLWADNRCVKNVKKGTGKTNASCDSFVCALSSEEWLMNIPVPKLKSPRKKIYSDTNYGLSVVGDLVIYIVYNHLTSTANLFYLTINVNSSDGSSWTWSPLDCKLSYNELDPEFSFFYNDQNDRILWSLGQDRKLHEIKLTTNYSNYSSSRKLTGKLTGRMTNKSIIKAHHDLKGRCRRNNGGACIQQHGRDIWSMYEDAYHCICVSSPPANEKEEELEWTYTEYLIPSKIDYHLVNEGSLSLVVYDL